MYPRAERSSTPLCTLYKGEGFQVSSVSQNGRWVYGYISGGASCGTTWGWVENGWFCS